MGRSQEAEAFSILEAKALTLSKLEAAAKAIAEARLFVDVITYVFASKKIGLQSKSFGKPRSQIS